MKLKFRVLTTQTVQEDAADDQCVFDFRLVQAVAREEEKTGRVRRADAKGYVRIGGQVKGS